MVQWCTALSLQGPLSNSFFRCDALECNGQSGLIGGSIGDLV